MRGIIPNLDNVLEIFLGISGDKIIDSKNIQAINPTNGNTKLDIPFFFTLFTKRIVNGMIKLTIKKLTDAAETSFIPGEQCPVSLSQTCSFHTPVEFSKIITLSKFTLSYQSTIIFTESDSLTTEGSCLKFDHIGGSLSSGSGGKVDVSIVVNNVVVSTVVVADIVVVVSLSGVVVVMFSVSLEDRIVVVVSSVVVVRFGMVVVDVVSVIFSEIPIVDVTHRTVNKKTNIDEDNFFISFKNHLVFVFLMFF